METFFEYFLYATAMIAVVLGIEGVARLARSQVGAERAVNRRLARARVQPSAKAQMRPPAGAELLARAIAARAPWLERALAQADAPFDALQLALAAVALFILVCAALTFAHAPGVIAIAAAAGFGGGAPLLLLNALAARRRKRFLDQLPQAVDLIARSLQAGHPVTTAMSVVGQRMAAPTGPEFRLVVEEMTYGLDRDVALGNLLQRFPLTELRMFVACLEVTRETGGNLAEVFLKLAEAIRAKEYLRRKVHAISAEGRMTFWVVSGLPVVVGGAIMLLRPGFFADVAGDPLFWPMMSASPICLVIGSAVIWRMVNFKI